MARITPRPITATATLPIISACLFIVNYFTNKGMTKIAIVMKLKL
jgi:hypothetical protein